MSKDVPIETRLAIARGILEEWSQAAYALRLRATIAVEVGDKVRAERAQSELENALKTIEALERQLAQLEKEAAAQAPVVRIPTGSPKPS